MRIKHSRLVLFALAAATIIIHRPAVARPPDTLKFRNSTFVKTSEQLFHEKILHVCVRNSDGREYPSALIFENKIVFYDSVGQPLIEHPFPNILEPKIKETATGEYIYIRGPFRNRTGGMHLIYRFDGETILEKETQEKIGPDGWGIPSESARLLVGVSNGSVIITGFDGEIRAQKALLDPKRGEDGDVFAAVSDDGHKVFAVANKYKLIPQTTESDTPLLYYFDSELNEVCHDTLHFTTVIELRCSPGGQYVTARAGLLDGRSPLIVLDSSGQELLRLENPQSIQFSQDSRCVLHLPRMGHPEVYSLAEHRLLYSPPLPRAINIWQGSDITGDCAQFILFDGQDIIIGDIDRKQIQSADFSFAFDLCRLSKSGTRIILGGEFGFVVYDAINQ